jgi:hypothetical protein
MLAAASAAGFAGAEQTGPLRVEAEPPSEVIGHQLQPRKTIAQSLREQRGVFIETHLLHAQLGPVGDEVEL